MNSKSDNSNGPIFVIGSPRSGTTLTAKILGKHSRIFMPGETHFFDDIYARRSGLGKPSDSEGINRILSRLSNIYSRYNEPNDQIRIDKLFSQEDKLGICWDQCKTYKDVLSSFMDIQMLYEEKKRWGNNTPKDLFNIKEILQFYPNAKFIICVRDPRAFLLSYKGKWKVTDTSQTARLQKLYHPIVTSLLWKSSMKKLPEVLEEIGDNNCIVVRYEDLVTSPEHTIKQVCISIGEDFEREMLTIDSQNSSHSEASHGGIFTTSIDCWQEKLSDEEIHIAQILLEHEMKYLGYDKIKVKNNAFRIFLIFLSVPFTLTRALYANRNNRGPLIPYLFKRIVTLVKKTPPPLTRKTS